MEGGGFRALSSYAGLTAGLLREGANAREEALARLFKGIDMLSTNSGGSWFIAALAYSPRFASVIHDMADDIDNAGNIYYDKVLQPFLDNLKGDGFDGTTMEFLQKVSAALRRATDSNAMTENVTFNLNWILELLHEFMFIADGSRNWEDFVYALFEYAMGINTTVPVGSPVNAWADGKSWLASVSLLTPGGKGAGTCASADAWLCAGSMDSIMGDNRDTTPVVVAHSADNQTNYYTHGENLDAQRSMYPAKFSVRLGGGKQQDAEYPFCGPFGDGGLCNSLSWTYQSSSGGSVTSGPAHGFPWYTQGVGNLSVAGIAGASSAFLGVLAMLPLMNSEGLHGVFDDIVRTLELIGLSKAHGDMLKEVLVNVSKTDWALWTYNRPAGGPNENMFLAGRDMVNEVIRSGSDAPRSLLEQATQGRLTALLDGVFTENSGVAHAVASGAVEVVAFFDGMSDFWYHFEGAPPTTSYISLLDSCPFCDVHCQIFQENYKVARDRFERNSTRFTYPGAKKLSSLLVGTIEAKTVDHADLGVTAGKSVTIHIVSVESGLGEGGYRYTDFSDLAKEVMLALQANRDAASQILGWLGR